MLPIAGAFGMKLKTTLGLAVMLALASTAALAFQEQKTGTMAPPAGSGAGIAAPAELGLSTTEAAKPSAGTEVRIPGLGKLGVLPKMDFGLELLYGAAEQKPVDVAPREPITNDDDLTIRGTVKHRF